MQFSTFPVFSELSRRITDTSVRKTQPWWEVDGPRSLPQAFVVDPTGFAAASGCVSAACLFVGATRASQIPNVLWRVSVVLIKLASLSLSLFHVFSRARR